ncbi:hypothetical protein KV112_08140 [Mycolicibacter sp. MYC123]|uniref:ESX-1 secretion-associated protein EspA/EspE-like domain-containing protein n=1 Tax=[Mycobacterium] zoologicum TaxID=2872311 RepID=A0ABU5YJN3_9MYCO|nr:MULTISPECIES: hypothetical protein [unclassified Mycolicibacter]MEB3049704.1 hypothetical protein [Mycolicibacter sp. MYC123]MEB3063419.1 hypothetical protein [Mycolicibacter sp. MYC101]
MSALSAMPAGLPTLPEVRSATFDHLGSFADWCESISAKTQTQFAEIAQQVRTPGGTNWEGSAANAAIHHADADVRKLRGWGWAHQDAAAVARRGQETLEASKRLVLDAVDDAERDGFMVSGEYRVVDTRPVLTQEQLIERQTQADAHSSFIRHRVANLVANDATVASQLITATADFGNLKFDETPGTTSGRRDGIQLVDWRQDGPHQPGGGYGSYHYGYEFSTPEGWTNDQVMSEVQHNFNKYFTFTADKSEIMNGAKINLKGPFGEYEPVQVTSVTPNSFSFVSLPGHSEGAGRVIRFDIVPAPASPIPGQLNWELQVAASGPLSKGSLIPGASWANKAIWQVFANNLNARLPSLPPTATSDW